MAEGTFQLIPPNTGASLSAEDANSIRKLWRKTLDVYEQTDDFFMSYEGASKQACICTINDTAKGAGQTLTITARAGYYGEGKLGDNSFDSTSDFETDYIGSYAVVVDWVRNATAINERAEELMGMRGELASGEAEELGRWMGRYKTDQVFATFRYLGGSRNLYVAAGQNNQDSLLSANQLTYNDIQTVNAALKPLGGKPALLTYDKNKSPVYRYSTVTTTNGMLGLKQDPDWRQMIREAGERGSENPLFTGKYYDVDDNIVREYVPIDHDGAGPVGCNFAPKALLGVAIPSIAGGGSGVMAPIQGGGNATYAAKTGIMYFKHFDNYAWPFSATSTLTPATGVSYFLVINPKAAGLPAGSDGKIGMYSFLTGNTGNTIQVINRLGAAAAGCVVTTLGNVVWNSGVWNGLHTDQHAVGAIIIPCNANGVPIGDTVMMGQAAMIRGYGKFRNVRREWLVDGGFTSRKYVASVFGQTLRTNVVGTIPGYIRIRHALTYPGLGLPFVNTSGGQ